MRPGRRRAGWRRGEPHESAIAGGEGISGASDGIAGWCKAGQSGADGRADVKAGARAGVLAGARPRDKAGHQIGRVETGIVQEAFGQRQRHGGVVELHWPGASWNGPPPTMSLRLAKSGLAVNSKVVPTASPTASPTSAPMARS